MNQNKQLLYLYICDGIIFYKNKSKFNTCINLIKFKFKNKFLSTIYINLIN